MQASAILYCLVLLQGALATPIEGPAPEVERRDIEPRAPTPLDIPFPGFPARNRGKKGGKGDDCATQQSTLCSAGSPYCCISDGNGGHVCQNTTACTQTVICCNNNNGFQICIGDLDFNMPITINIYT
ncbi:hypothetical protein B0T10DRAFT_524179 [Thelonectria olida]|uniref:Hydrophobin n=1 Tax=Thelonectria olida TaxID=1576542 RepID=A0A9P8VRC6_9HYPO|nr:hypothetical protein B0T10DRAFT_524179 [Thelonectria olida]